MPDLKGSWFDPPDKDDHQDSTTYWNANTKFPRKARLTPLDYHLKAPPRCPYYHIENKELKRLLEAPIFKSIDLDHAAFESSACDVSNSNLSNLDSMLRSSLLDNFTLDEYLKLIIELIPKIAEEHSESSDDNLVSLDVLMRVVVLAAESNQRSGQAQIGSFIANKVALRDLILNKFSTPSISRNILRGSSFLSDKLFGNLPESYKTSLKQSGNNLRCKTRYSNSVSSHTSNYTSTPRNLASSEKRSAYYQQSNSAKKSRSDKGKGPVPAKKSKKNRKNQNKN